MQEVQSTKAINPNGKIVLPFLETSFATNLKLIFILWPLWWVLGIEQFVPFIFLVWELVRHSLTKEVHFRIGATERWSIMLALWWIIPILWVDRAEIDLFLRELSVMWSQVFILILINTSVRSYKEWKKILRGLTIFSVFIVIGGLIYILGLWRGEITSLLGQVLPATLNSSEFFSSISIRDFGMISVQKWIFTHRVSSFSLQVGSLSIICVLLIPLIFWQFYRSRRSARIGWAGLLIGLLIVLIQTESRFAYLAFIGGLILFLFLFYYFYFKSNRILLVLLILISITLILLFGFIIWSELIELIQVIFLDARSGSFNTRIIIYRETIKLLGEHIFAGWGLPVKIEGIRTVFSAGTHNSYLGILFQHGLIGLFLYLGIWFSIWINIIRNLRLRTATPVTRMFWIVSSCAMLAFNIREIAANWWWDQSITMVLWAYWGLMISAPKFTKKNPQGKVSQFGK